MKCQIENFEKEIIQLNTKHELITTQNNLIIEKERNQIGISYCCCCCCYINNYKL